MRNNGELKMSTSKTTTKAKKSSTKKSAKKSTARRPNKSKAARPASKSVHSGDGYKGHRAGTMKEKLHKLFDELGDEKGMAKALKLDGVAKSTVLTSFSQFRTGKL